MVIQSQLLIRIIRKSGFLFIPKIIRISFLAIAQEVIAPEKKRVKAREIADAPPDRVVKQAGRFVKGAGPDAIGTIRSILGPELKAGFGIDRPPQYARPVGNIIGLVGGCAMGNGFAGAFIGTFFTSHTEIPDTELNGPVRQQRQICQHFGQSNPGSKGRGDQQAVARQFPQPGVNRDGYAAGRIIAASDGIVPQTPDMMGQETCGKGHFRISQSGGIR